LTQTGRIRLAELTSGAGAVVLGIGLGVLLAGRLADAALPILASGIVVHAWGMYDKHRLERSSGLETVWWAPVVYGACWVMLGLVALAIVARLSGLL
jgi:uncharacterized membrane protein YecN with MAPEG domain